MSRDRNPMRYIPDNYWIFYLEQKSPFEFTRLEQRIESYSEKSAIWRPSWKMADCETATPGKRPPLKFCF